MTEKIKSEVISRRRVFSLLGLAIASGLVATIPVSPQVTPRGLELSVDQAQAVTYRRARVTARRVDRRDVPPYASRRAAWCLLTERDGRGSITRPRRRCD